MRRLILASTLVLATSVTGAACATKGFVNTRVDDVDGKVTVLTGTLEETQARTKQNEGRISEVDQKAGAAQATATGAAERAVAAQNEAKAVGARTDELAAASRKLVYEVVLSEDQGNFAFNAVTLPDAAKARIDELVAQLLADPKGAFFEIEGHTDNTGPASINERIGLERADTVKRYLYEAHQIPLHKINIISFGEAKPVAPNTSRDGRAQNRRVVIRVLS